MRATRPCSRVGCNHSAVATLTYVYSDSTAVLGPLATHAEPHTYDLCSEHADRLTAPRGWDIVRLATEFEPAPPSTDDLLALADAVREASRAPAPPAPTLPRTSAASPGAPAAGPPRGSQHPAPGARNRSARGHLSVVRTDEDA